MSAKLHNRAEATSLSYLFVPGNRPERFKKALASGAHRVIFDLEDAVAPEEKQTARSAISDWLKDTEYADAIIRINDSSTIWFAEDLEFLRQCHGCDVMLPKCESAAQITAVCSQLRQGASVYALIENAKAMVALNEIAATPGVHALAFGSLDYLTDLNIPSLRDSDGKSRFALDFAASQIVIASKAAGLPAPIAGVTPELDAQQVAIDTVHARSLGFGAKMCIHPMQVQSVNMALAPTQAELAWAEKVLLLWNSSTGGAMQLDGKMIDRPVALKAERLVALASSLSMAIQR
jgi:citrate lyase subunit beta / citryl-CoA lyase